MWPMMLGRRFDMIASGVSSKEGRAEASGRVRGGLLSSDADRSSVESSLCYGGAAVGMVLLPNESRLSAPSFLTQPCSLVTTLPFCRPKICVPIIYLCVVFTLGFVTRQSGTVKHSSTGLII